MPTALPWPARPASPFARRVWTSPWIGPLCVLLLSLSFTLPGWFFVQRSGRATAQARFHRETEIILHRLHEHFADHEHALLECAGLFAVQGQIHQAHWRTWVDALYSVEHHPRGQTLGYAAYLPPAPDNRLRSPDFPDSARAPVGSPAVSAPVRLLEPAVPPGTPLSLGADLAAEPLLLAAMLRARDEGRAILSCEVTLLPAGPDQPPAPGFFIFQPVYDRALPRTSPAECMAALRGFLFTVIRTADFTRDLLPAEFPGLALTLREGVSDAPGPCLYDSTLGLPPAELPVDFHPVLARTVPLTALGRTWSAEFHTLPSYPLSPPGALVPLIYLTGLLCSLLAAGLTAFLTGRNRALDQVGRMTGALVRARDELDRRVRERTAELTHANARLEKDIVARRKAEAGLANLSAHYRMLLSVASDGIHVLDLQGGIFECSESFRRMLGYEPGEMASLRACDWEAVLPPEAIPARIQELLRRPALFETRHRRRDGTDFPVEVNAHGIELDGQLYLYCSARDITERKQAEMAAREGELRFGTMADAAPVLIWVAGPDLQGNYFNRTWLEFTGRSAEQERGNGWSAGIHPDDLPRIREILQNSFAARHPFRLEYRHRRHDGTYRWMLCHGVPRFHPEGGFAGFVGSCIDLTDKREIEDRLRLQSAAMSASASAIVITTIDGTVQWVNAAFTRNCGYTFEEIVGKKPSLLRSGQHLAGFYRELWDTILRGEDWRGEMCNRRKDGSLYHEEMSITPVRDQATGAISHFIAIKTDISERKRAEESLRTLSDYARSLIEASLDPLVTIDACGLITDVNEASVLVTGVPREHQIGTDFSGYFTAPDQAREVYQRALAEGHVRDFPLAIRHASGRTVDVLYNASVYRDAHGHILGVFAAARDVTERNRLLQQTVQDARAKSDLLREINHRVTNNLTSILGLFIGESQALEAAQRPLVKPVLDRLSQRILSLLNAHRMLSDTQWAPVRLDKLALQIVRAAVAADPGRLAATVQVPPADILVSPRQASTLALVLNELTINSIKYGRHDPEPLCLSVTIETAADFITLCYHDNGPGYDPEVLAGHRSSIGLQLIRQMVGETLRGRLTLRNRPGAETTLQIRIEDRGRT